MAESARLLVIEDELSVRRFLRASLEPAAYKLIEADTGETGIRAAATENPDVVLLDLGLPDVDGIDVVKSIREWSQVPIVVLSARGQEHDKIAALDAGADDYLTKPFGIGELLARIRASLRRQSQRDGRQDDPILQVGDLRIDLPMRQVFRDEREVHLTPIEFRLLAFLVRHAGRVITHRQLLTEVWGEAYAHETHYLRVYMGQLRHKLEADPSRPSILTTEPGVGYRLRAE